ncbi:hypothetical protein ACLMJK_003027 [Lecanora helva]
MYSGKEQLDQTFDDFSITLKPSPLSGRTNEELIYNRGAVFDNLLIRIAKFRVETVQKFESDVDRIKPFSFLSAAGDAIGHTSPYKLRFDALHCRGRLIVMEESSRMLGILEAFTDPSQHNLVMIEGMQRLLIREAKDHLADVKGLIAACEVKNLRRLEAETRLIQIMSYVLLRDQNVRADLDVDASFERILDLCGTYPDTAGQLRQTYHSVKGVYDEEQSTANLYTKGAQRVWWKWPRHHIGYLQYCPYGHPYSSARTNECPECGRHVPRNVDPNSHLREQDFLDAMKTFTFPSVYGQQHRQGQGQGQDRDHKEM